VSSSNDRTRVALVALDGQTVPDWVLRELDRDGIELTIGECTTRAELAEHAAEADVVWLFGGSRVLMDGNLAAVPRCWAVIRTGSGTDNVPVDEATRRGIVVANTPAAFSDGVSDQVIALLFSAVRRIGSLDRSMRLGRWEQTTAQPLNSVEGKTLGLVGFGHVGQLVTRKLSGFGMQVLAHDPYADAGKIAAHGVKPVSLKSLLAESDYISLHCPLTPETTHLIGEAEFRLMKPTAIFINTSRGPVVDEPVLIRALAEGWIAAAGLDVFELEPPAPDNPLLKMDNVVLTPHGAGYSVNGVELRWRHSIETVTALARRRWPPSCVNPQVKPVPELSR
jgi:D-3-phosphoglycerate dehydrogenase